MPELLFHDFKMEVEAAGLIARDCGCGHWQIKGGKYTVNYYPDTKRGPRKHVNGTRGATQAPSIQNVIHAAFNGTAGTKPGTRTTNVKYIHRVKRKLLKKDPHCRYCGCKLTFTTATIDHLFPLSQGGHNGMDNLVLACQPCNHKKGAKLPKGK